MADNRVVISVPNLNGGSPTVEGTRLTCSNVVQLLRRGENLVHYYQKEVFLLPEKIHESLRYCSEKRCLNEASEFCEHCTLYMGFQTDREQAEFPREDLWKVAKALLAKKSAYWNTTLDGRPIPGG